MKAFMAEFKKGKRIEDMASQGQYDLELKKSRNNLDFITY